MIPAKTREVRLASIPDGMPKESDFRLVETPIPSISEGEALVRTLFVGVHPGMRSRMRDANRPFGIGDPVASPSVARVIESRVGSLKPDELVTGGLPWREYNVVRAGRPYQPWVTAANMPLVTDASYLRDHVSLLRPANVPPQLHLGALGSRGFVAYVGLIDIGRPAEGETVFISAAAGSVGSLAGQIAQLYGCRVVGSAGTDEKVRLVQEELGFDGAFNYRATSPGEALDQLCPDGIDIYFDNVGGEQLEAALLRMRYFGRIVACGSVSAYNDPGSGPPLRGLRRVTTHRLRIEGFVIRDHAARFGAFFSDMSTWLREGTVRNLETLFKGLENAPAALVSTLQGGNVGHSTVQVTED